MLKLDVLRPTWDLRTYWKGANLSAMGLGGKRGQRRASSLSKSSSCAALRFDHVRLIICTNYLLQIFLRTVASK